MNPNAYIAIGELNDSRPRGQEKKRKNIAFIKLTDLSIKWQNIFSKSNF